MSNLYDKASLIITPNAYKASKIYSLKPTDGSGDLSFSRAGSKMRRNSAGLWETIGTNIPPLHYPVGGGCPSWLFEAEATNVIEYSETLQDCGTEATTIAPDAAISPRGTMTAASILETNVTANHDIFRFRDITIGTKYTQSIRVKPNGRTWAVFVFLGVSGGFAYQKVWFNLTGTGSVGTQQAGIDAASIELDSEGYYFIQATATALATVNEAFIVGIADADNNTNYAGDITKGLYTWNYQIETGRTATSPIITAGSSVTRLADNPYETGLISNGLLSATGGTWFCEFNNVKSISSSTSWYLGSSSSNKITFGGQPALANTLFIWLYNGGIETLIGNTPTGTKIKMCIVFSPTQLKIFGNGALLYTLTQSLNVHLWSEFNSLSMNSFSAEIDEQIMYTTQLSNTEAIELTTL